MKYTVTVDGDVFEIEIGPDARAWVNQQPYDVDLWHMDGNGEYSLLFDNRSYEVHVAGNGGDVSNVMVGRRSYRARLQRGHSVLGVETADAAQADARPPWLDRRPSMIVEVRAPLPGLLLENLPVMVSLITQRALFQQKAVFHPEFIGLVRYIMQGEIEDMSIG